VIVLGCRVIGTNERVVSRAERHEVMVVDPSGRTCPETSFCKWRQISVQPLRTLGQPDRSLTILKIGSGVRMPRCCFGRAPELAQWLWACAFSLNVCRAGPAATQIPLSHSRCTAASNCFNSAAIPASATILIPVASCILYEDGDEIQAREETGELLRARGLDIEIKTPEGCL